MFLLALCRIYCGRPVFSRNGFFMKRLILLVICGAAIVLSEFATSQLKESRDISSFIDDGEQRYETEGEMGNSPDTKWANRESATERGLLAKVETLRGQQEETSIASEGQETIAQIPEDSEIPSELIDDE